MKNKYYKSFIRASLPYNTTTTTTTFQMAMVLPRRRCRAVSSVGRYVCSSMRSSSSRAGTFLTRSLWCVVAMASAIRGTWLLKGKKMAKFNVETWMFSLDKIVWIRQWPPKLRIYDRIYKNRINKYQIDEGGRVEEEGPKCVELVLLTKTVAGLPYY